MNSWDTIGLITLVLASTLSIGCSSTPNKPALFTQEIKCPEGAKQCAWEYVGPVRFGGGGRTTMAGVAGGECVVKQGNDVVVKDCGVKAVTGTVKDDRIDVVGKTVIDGASRVMTGYQLRRGAENAAWEHAEAVKTHSENHLEGVKYRVDNTEAPYVYDPTVVNVKTGVGLSVDVNEPPCCPPLQMGD